MGAGAPLVLFAGPCVIEGREALLRIAETLAVLADRLRLPLVFKASFDKANRTSAAAFRGPGLEDGLADLCAVKEAFDLPLLTDIHHPEQAAPAAAVCDFLQIPAFLCRQTDLIRAAARTGAALNIKKGQFMAPGDMVHAVEKAVACGNRNVFLTERGTAFGYNDLVVDFRGLALMRKICPVVFDATHSLQRPGAAGGASGGSREYLPQLVRAAAAAGIDGLFLEVHPEPDRGLSDPATMFPLAELEPLIKSVLAVRVAAGEGA